MDDAANTVKAAQGKIKGMLIITQMSLILAQMGIKCEEMSY